MLVERETFFVKHRLHVCHMLEFVKQELEEVVHACPRASAHCLVANPPS